MVTAVAWIECSSSFATKWNDTRKSLLLLSSRSPLLLLPGLDSVSARFAKQQLEWKFVQVIGTARGALSLWVAFPLQHICGHVPTDHRAPTGKRTVANKLDCHMAVHYAIPICREIRPSYRLRYTPATLMLQIDLVVLELRREHRWNKEGASRFWNSLCNFTLLTLSSPSRWKGALR